MIIDSAIIEVKSGRGGDGSCSFLREKHNAKGGPDGGNGGDGGDVIFIADPEVETLLDFSGKHHWKAPAGDNGTSRDCDGKSGKNLMIHVPVGTIVYDEPVTEPIIDPDIEVGSDEWLMEMFLTSHEKAAIHAPDPDSVPTGEMLIDLSKAGQTYTIAKGGKGGKGNAHFASPTHQAPREFEIGGDAETARVRLELKIMADIGLLGKPNAGKSTFLGHVSQAEPRIGAYPFTTIKPQLGVAISPKSKRHLVIADIPGLIENAHEGAGMGIRFLRHVERCNTLLHLLECDPTDGSDPMANYIAIRQALKGHSQELAQRKEIVVLSKADLMPNLEDRDVLMEMMVTSLGIRPMFISAATGEGIAQLLETLAKNSKVALKDRPDWQLE